MHLGFVSEMLLRPPFCLPELSNLPAECLRNGVCAFRHMHMLSLVDPERDRPIVVTLEVTCDETMQFSARSHALNRSVARLKSLHTEWEGVRI